MPRQFADWVFRHSLQAALLLFFMLLPCRAQKSAQMWTGTVRNASGAPVSGARIRLVAEGVSTAPVQATSGADGSFRVGPLIPGQYRLSLQLSSSTGSPVSGKLTGLQSAGDPSDANVIQSAASDLTWRRVGQDDFVEARLREPFQSRVLSLARASQWGCLNHCLLRASIRRAHSIHNHCKKYERSLCLWNRTLCRSWVSCPTRQAHNSHGISRTAMMRPPSQLHEFANWTSFCNQVKHPCFLLSQLRSVHLSSYVKRQKRRTRLNSFA